MIKIAILASGSGTNAENIAKYFDNHPSIAVAVIMTNNKNAGVIERASKLGVPCHIFSKAELEAGDVTDKLLALDIDFIVLAGFMMLIPLNMLEKYPDKMVNIHPALLPRYGGKGMYGMHVHKAVVEAGEIESGITIHLVNEEYDKGRVLFQKAIPVGSDNAEALAQRIHALEYKHYPEVIEEYLSS
jgi:phosphoribosylglycinamide formyltransferase-1